MADIKEFLNQINSLGLLRKLNPVSGRSDGKIIVCGQEYFDFSSNDYLGLSGHPKIIEASIKAAKDFGASVSASRLMTGSMEFHHTLEKMTAEFKNMEDALIFNSGYQANTGIIPSLYSKGDVIFSDRFNHASIVDGIILSRAKLFRFQHNDLGHLEELLKGQRSKFKNALIITESIFSMDGDKPDLRALVNLKEKYNCSLMVDEAHATGIFGKNGSGMVEEEGLSGKVDLVMGTFSKAMGSLGAYLACSKDIKEYLVNTARSFIYSTALPASIVAANIASIEIIKSEPARRTNLFKSAQYLRDLLKEKGFVLKGDYHIVPVIVGEAKSALELSNILKEKGYWVMAVRPPTVPQGQARLRISLSAIHQRKALEGLVKELVRI